jgi:dephospho-CoA kinase
MLHVGLTGNIGSGKSTVAGIFSVLGIPVYHADVESKKILALPDVEEVVISSLGRSICGEGNRIDRKALANLVFNNPEALATLNGILHPLVLKDAMEWVRKQQGVPYVIHEAAVIYESGFSGAYDRIIQVSCPKELTIDRVISRDGSSREEVLQRMRNQWEDDVKSNLADFVIVNDDTTLVIPQVVSIHQTLTGGDPLRGS